MKIKVGVSNRHVHLTEEIYNKLFDEELEVLRYLDQPEQFAAKQTVTIKTANGFFENVRIVGPLRDYNQIEISKTDSYKLKVNPPIRTSGDLEGSLPITIIGPKGEVNLDKGLILANRHIHLTEEDIKKWGLENTEKVVVKINGEKAGILKNVYLKVTKQASLRLHLDTDDANAFNLRNDDEVEVLKERNE
ncbi:MAG: phosphate propanoyltransferase [Bacilli bacterium]|nr:phosphate propanoyltransferase [Bacilli bacterium]